MDPNVKIYLTKDMMERMPSEFIQEIEEQRRATLITQARAAIPELSKLRDDTSFDDLMIELARIRPGWKTINDKLFQAREKAGTMADTATWREILGLGEGETVDDWQAAAKTANQAYEVNQRFIRWALKDLPPGWEIEKPAGANEGEWIHKVQFFTISTLLLIETERREADIAKALKRRRRELPSHLPQSTFHEMKNLTIAVADGPTGKNWEPILGEVALKHAIPGEPLQTKLVAGELYKWRGLPETHEGLYNDLKSAGAPAALFYHLLVSYTITEGTFTIAIDDLIKLLGWDKKARLSKAKREECRRQVWEWLLMFTDLQIIGIRPGTYRHPDTKEKLDLTSYDPFILIAGKRMPAQMTLNDSETPIDVTIAPGAWIERYRGDRRVLANYGNVLLLAGIPAEKPSGAWAQSIGLALNQKWRETSTYSEIRRVGENNKISVKYPAFTRRELLETIPPLPEFDVHVILNGPNPKRAQSYWKEAIKKLKDRGVIGFYAEQSKIPTTRSGWKEAWLDQKLDIRPKVEGLKATVEIKKSAEKARRARTRKTTQKR